MPYRKDLRVGLSADNVKKAAFHPSKANLDDLPLFRRISILALIIGVLST